MKQFIITGPKYGRHTHRVQTRALQCCWICRGGQPDFKMASTIAVAQSIYTLQKNLWGCQRYSLALRRAAAPTGCRPELFDVAEYVDGVNQKMASTIDLAKKGLLFEEKSWSLSKINQFIINGCKWGLHTHPVQTSVLQYCWICRWGQPHFKIVSTIAVAQKVYILQKNLELVKEAIGEYVQRTERRNNE